MVGESELQTRDFPLISKLKIDRELLDVRHWP